MRGGGVRVEDSRLPTWHHEQVIPEDSRGPALCQAPVPRRNGYLGREGKSMGYRLWAEVGKAQNGQQEGQRTTYLLCSTNSLFEGKGERERERRPGRGREYVIHHVPSWFSIVSIPRPTPVP